MSPIALNESNFSKVAVAVDASIEESSSVYAVRALGTDATVNVFATVVLAALTVAPLTFVHPFRVTRLMPVNVGAAVGWMAATAVLVARYPDGGPAVQSVWWLCGGWLMLISAVRTGQEWRSRRSGVLR